MLKEVPSILSYPHVQSLSEVEELVDRYVYIIEQYKMDGLSVVAKRYDDETSLKFGDWDGNELPNCPIVDSFMKEHANKLVTLMVRIRLSQIQLYFSNNVLVDARVSRDLFLGPGMIKDVFGRIIPTQTIIGKPLVLKKEILEAINNREAPYEKPIIIKATSFKTIVRGNELLPMYATVG